MQILTREQVRSLDRLAVERFEIPSIVLMENAGRGATEVLLRRVLATAGTPMVAIVAGRGNNGGDGFVVARHLALRGIGSEVFILGDPERFRGPGDAGANFTIVERMGLAIHAIDSAEQLEKALPRFGVAVDALLGTGLTGEVRGLVGECIEVLNAWGRPVFSLDVPSGLDCDTGLPLGRAVRATATVTFAAMKPGLADGRAEELTGPVDVVDIGAPLVWE
jgi:NAD(P)H-hydrate epimerase